MRELKKLSTIIERSRDGLIAHAEAMTFVAKIRKSINEMPTAKFMSMSKL